MNGIKFLLDTNIVIGLLKQGLSILPNQNITFANSAISQITRNELLSFPRITVDEENAIRHFTDCITVINLNEEIEHNTIHFRRVFGGKLPDAIIIATAQTYHLELITLDNKMKATYQLAIK